MSQEMARGVLIGMAIIGAMMGANHIVNEIQSMKLTISTLEIRSRPDWLRAIPEPEPDPEPRKEKS